MRKDMCFLIKLDFWLFIWNLKKKQPNVGKEFFIKQDKNPIISQIFLVCKKQMWKNAYMKLKQNLTVWVPCSQTWPNYHKLS